MGHNSRSELAQELLELSANLAGIIERIANIERIAPDVPNNEGDACDMLIIQGENVASAMKRIAMYLDRAAISSFQNIPY